MSIAQKETEKKIPLGFQTNVKAVKCKEFPNRALWNGITLCAIVALYGKQMSQHSSKHTYIASI